MTKRSHLFIIILSLIVVLFPGKIFAQSNKSEIFGLISGGVGGTYAQFAQNISDVTFDPERFRVLPILGRGSQQNIRDLSTILGIHAAIVQNDVLTFFKNEGSISDIDVKIQYITKLYNEEIHFLTTSKIASVKELDGAVVNFGRSGSGTAMTAAIIFDAFRDLGVEVTPANMPDNEALDALKNGVIDAMVSVVGKPSSFYQKIAASKDLRFLPVELTKALEENYVEGEFTHADYPNLIGRGEVVPTIAVGAVLAAYRPRSKSSRARMSTFVESLFGSIETLKSGPYHKKWQEVDLHLNVAGWQRVEAALDWLNAN